MKHCFLVLALLVLPAAAQEQKQHFTINVGTPEGQMLQSIGQESDDGDAVSRRTCFSGVLGFVKQAGNGGKQWQPHHPE